MLILLLLCRLLFVLVSFCVLFKLMLKIGTFLLFKNLCVVSTFDLIMVVNR